MSLWFFIDNGAGLFVGITVFTLVSLAGLLMFASRDQDARIMIAFVSHLDVTRTYLADGPGLRMALFEAVSSEYPERFDEGDAHARDSLGEALREAKEEPTAGASGPR